MREFFDNPAGCVVQTITITNKGGLMPAKWYLELTGQLMMSSVMLLLVATSIWSVIWAHISYLKGKYHKAAHYMRLCIAQLIAILAIYICLKGV